MLGGGGPRPWSVWIVQNRNTEEENSMAIIELKPEKSDYKYLFSPYDTPMAHINPGDTVVFHTNDAATGRIQTPRIYLVLLW